MEGRRLRRRGRLGMSSAAREAAAATTDLQDAAGRRRRRRRDRSRGATTLMYAAQQGDVDRVRRIIRAQSASLFDRDRSGKTALHYCCTSDNLCAAHAADLLVMAAPDLVDGRDEDGFTPLHLAVIAGNMQLVTFLLANNADVHAVDNEKHTVVHWATVCGETAALRAVLAAGAPVSTPDVHGGFPLHYAAQMCGGPGNDRESSLGIQVLHTLLTHKDIDVAVADGDKRQPLLWAASAGSAKALLALVRAGAAVEAADKDGLTALHCAASRGHTDCLDTLLTLCGASPDVIDSNGCTALHYAVTLGHADATALLLAHGADPNRQDRKGRSPAHCGCAKGQFETVKLIGAHQANLWLRNARGDLPLHEAAASGRRDLVKWLLEMRPSQVNARNNDGRCPLHMAALNDNTDMCKILLDAGAHVNPVLRTSRNVFMTPLDCALQRGFRSTAKYLQLHGGVPANRLADMRNQPSSALHIRDDVTFWGDSSSESEKGQDITKTGKKSYRKKAASKLERAKISLSESDEENKRADSSKLNSTTKPRKRSGDRIREQRASANVENSTPSAYSAKRSNTKKSSSRMEYTNEIIINGKTEINIHQTREIIVEREPKLVDKVTETVLTENVPQSASSVRERRPRSAKFSKGKDRSGRNSAEKETAKPRSSITSPKTIIQQETESRQLSLKTQSTNTSEETAETVIENKKFKPIIEENGFLKDSKQILDQQSLRSNTSEDVEEHKEFVVEASVHEPPKSHTQNETENTEKSPQKVSGEKQENDNLITDEKLQTYNIPQEETHEDGSKIDGPALELEKEADVEKNKDQITETADTTVSNAENNENNGELETKLQVQSNEHEQDISDDADIESKNSESKNDDEPKINSTSDLQNDEATPAESEVGTDVQETHEKQTTEEIEQLTPNDKGSVETTDDLKIDSSKVQTDTEVEESKEEVPQSSQPNVDQMEHKIEGNEKVGFPEEKEKEDTAEQDTVIDDVSIGDINRTSEKTENDITDDTHVEDTLGKEQEEKEDKEHIPDGKTGEETEIKSPDLTANNITKEAEIDTTSKPDHVQDVSLIKNPETTQIEKVEPESKTTKKRVRKQKVVQSKPGVEFSQERTGLKDSDTNKTKYLKVEKPRKKWKGKPDDYSDDDYSSRSEDMSVSTPTRKSHKSFRVLDEESQKTHKAKVKRSEKKEPRSRSEENKRKDEMRERDKFKHSKIPMPLGKTTLSKSDRHLDKTHMLEKRALQGVLDERVPSLPNIHHERVRLKEPPRSESNMSAPLLASQYSDNESLSDVEHAPRSLVARNKKRIKKRTKTREARSAGSDYESSNLIDSGFEPSPRSTRIPKWKNMSNRGVNMTSVTQNIQSNIRRYHLERKIFQHLLELKRNQIRAGQHNEAVLVKRAIDSYHQSCASTVGAGRYIPEDYTFKSFETFLYESLRKLQKSDVAYMKGLPEAPTNPLLCTRSTNRCMHATHAYTGVPCAAYLPKMDHHTIPKIGFNNVSCKPGTGFLPHINSKKAVTLELSHGTDKQVISLPTDRLDQNKRYYVTFTVKGHEPSSSNEEDGHNTNAHIHSKSE